MAISNKVGPPVTGEDFYGRSKELAHAHEFLDTKHSLVLSAPRRIGKSSFAKRLVEDKESTKGAGQASEDGGKCSCSSGAGQKALSFETAKGEETICTCSSGAGQ